MKTTGRLRDPMGHKPADAWKECPILFIQIFLIASTQNDIFNVQLQVLSKYFLKKFLQYFPGYLTHRAFEEYMFYTVISFTLYTFPSLLSRVAFIVRNSLFSSKLPKNQFQLIFVTPSSAIALPEVSYSPYQIFFLNPTLLSYKFPLS